MQQVVIRPEGPDDAAAIRALTIAAFSYAGAHRQQEANLVEALRASPAFVPELSLVAEVGGRIAGHIMFTRVAIAGDEKELPALALAPLSVLRGYERRYVGTRLVRAGLAAAAELGHGIVIVLGHPRYYPRFGFVPAAPLQIRAPWPGVGDAFMVRALKPGTLKGVAGLVRYPSEFDTVS